MNWDQARFCAGAVLAHRLRAFLSVLGVAIGIAAVVLLTSIGEGTRAYVLEQFTQFGTNILAINPGKTETVGIPGVVGGTTHKLTIDDALAIERIDGVERVVPVTIGQARVEAKGRDRSVYVYGVTSDMPEMWKFEVAQGSFLPAGDPRKGSAVAVLGATLKRELFGEENALGKIVRIGGTRLRVIGVLAAKGQILGFDLDDAAYVPVATSMRMFNLDELAEIDVVFAHESQTDQVEADVRKVLKERHRGNEDFTITTQSAMLEVFDNVLSTVTLAMMAIGAISLFVGAIGILTMMWIAVGERTAEIGLLRALGATRRQILLLFLGESAFLSLLGGLLGVGVGLGLTQVLRALLGLPLETPPGFLVAAVAVSMGTGIVAGVIPARRAAAMDPVEALRAE